MTTPPRIAIVGGGIAGLAAAHAAASRGAHVELFDASTELGGKIRTSPFAGLPGIDEGPDAFLARVPWATALAREVGLGDELVSPATGSAGLWMGRMHPIPGGLLLGLPTGVASLAASRLLSVRGKLRAGLEPLAPRGSLDHDSLGTYVRHRFGREVHERLVDPLIGSIYAADTDRFSLNAVPQLAELARATRSVLLSSKRRAAARPSDGPVFYAPRAGMGALVARVADAVLTSGGLVHVDAPVAAVSPHADGWTVSVDGRGDHGPFDGVVMATPAAAARAILMAGEVVDADSAEPLQRIETADVAMVTLAVDARRWPTRLRGMSGYLVPKPAQQLVTAASFGSQKWRHWDNGTSVILRVSLGRDGLPVLHLDDDTLTRAAVDELGRHLEVDLEPTEVRVTRWHGAFPQYRPHHAALATAAQEALPSSIRLAGASYHGIGIPACVHSAQRAAALLVAAENALPQ